MLSLRLTRSRGTAVRRGALVRLLATGWLVLYAVMVGGLPIADARAETGGRVVPHWEASESPCSAGHHGELCQLCQVLTAAVEPSEQIAVETSVALASREILPLGSRGEKANGCRAGPSSRAPPLS